MQQASDVVARQDRIVELDFTPTSPHILVNDTTSLQLINSLPNKILFNHQENLSHHQLQPQPRFMELK